MPLQLIVNLGTERRLFPLASSPMRIGRGSNNAIQIPDPTVSKEHAEIAPAGSGWTIRDLGSRNGTRVNGNEVHEAVAIRENDALEIGKVQARLGTDAAAGMAATVFSPAGGLSSSLNLGAREILARGGSGGAESMRLVKLLTEAGRMLVLPRPLKETCEDILGFVEQAVPATRLVILLARDGHPEPEQIAARTHGGSSKQPLAISRSILHKVLNDCASVILGDASEDPHFGAQHSVIMQKIRSAMAVPLFDNERVLGVLYVDSIDPTQVFNRDQLEALTLLANMAAVKITNARLLEAEQSHQRVIIDLATATRIQRGLLFEPPRVAGWSIDARLVTCHEVGGDLYDFHVRADGSLVFLLGDVSGKGISAALLMSSALSSSRTLYEACSDPLDLMVRLNGVMVRSVEPGRFVTMFVGILDPATGKLRYVNAGHNPPFVFGANGIRRLEEGGVPVAVMAGARYAAGEDTLESGELFVGFTDGIPEAQRGEEMFEEERLVDAIQHEPNDAPLDSLGRHVMTSVDEFLAGGRRTDDITLVLLRRD